ncbi:AI-2E family transporter [Halobacteriales archaeon Cl-PHB]
MDAERGFQVALLAVAIVLTFLLLRPFLSVILGAVLLAYLLSTPYAMLEPLVGERLAAMSLILTTLLVLAVPVVLLVNVVMSGVDDLLATLGEETGLGSYEGVQALLTAVFGTEFDGGGASLLELLRSGQLLEMAQTALDTFGGLSQVFVHLTVLLFVWYYLLKDGDRLVAWVAGVMPLSGDLQATLVERADDLMYIVVVGNFVVAVADGVLVGAGLWAAGFPDPVFWTFIAVFLALIPLVGTMLLWVPAAAYLVLVGDVTAGAILFLYGFIVVGSVDNVLRPFLGAPEVGLEPGLFVVGVLAGLSLFGVLGIFYGPVLLVLAKVVVETVGEELQESAA